MSAPTDLVQRGAFRIEVLRDLLTLTDGGVELTSAALRELIAECEQATEPIEKAAAAEPCRCVYPDKCSCTTFAETTAEAFRFRVAGLADNGPSRRNYDVPVDEVFLVLADDVGDALTDLIRRSAIWEQIDAERGFTIEYLVGEDFPAPSAEQRREALERRLASLTDYGARHGNVPNLQHEIDAVRAELDKAERCGCGERLDANGEHDGGYGGWCS